MANPGIAVGTGAVGGGFGAGAVRDSGGPIKANGLDHCLGLPVRHGHALALVSTAVIGAWIWAILQQVAIDVQSDDNGNWFRTAPHSQWIALAAAVILTGCVFRFYLRHDRPPAAEEKPTG